MTRMDTWRRLVAIVGGESGHGARPMEEAWVLAIQRQCRRAGVPFFFKQWGGPNKKRAGRLLRGRTWDAMPSRLETAASWPEACTASLTTSMGCSTAMQRRTGTETAPSR